MRWNTRGIFLKRTSQPLLREMFSHFWYKNSKFEVIVQFMDILRENIQSWRIIIQIFMFSDILFSKINLPILQMLVPGKLTTMGKTSLFWTKYLGYRPKLTQNSSS